MKKCMVVFLVLCAMFRTAAAFAQTEADFEVVLRGLKEKEADMT